MGIISKFFDGVDSVAYFVLLSSAVKIALACARSKRLVGRVGRLFLYPVKSMAGIEVKQLECRTPGPCIGRVGDRNFLVVKGDKNLFVTARSEQRLLLISTQVISGNLHLTAENMTPLIIDINKVEDSKDVRHASVHDGVPVVGLDCGDEAGAWLDEFLQKPGHRLIFAAPSVERRSFQNGTVKYKAWTAHIDPSAKMAYQDSTAYHVVSEASVADVCSKIDSSLKGSVSATNFRPNIIAQDVPAFDEDSWVKVYIGDAEFSRVKLCSRCIFTTIDPKTAERSEEPLVSLRSYRKLVPSFDQAPCFGLDLILNRQGTIRVGDAIYAVTGQPRLAP